MELLNQIFPHLPVILQMMWTLFFTYHGWILCIVAFYHMFKFSYVEEIQHQFLLKTDWVFLQIVVPRENTQSLLAVENIFSQIHVLHRSLTFAERYVEGKFQLWYSMEIVSLGGKVSFVVRAPKKSQHLVESAFYSHYPTAEIHEVEDYLKNFNYDAKDPNTEIFGVEFKLKDDHLIPLRTYKDLEHPSAEDPIIDPLRNLFEVMERMPPSEFAAIQILIQPIQYEDLKSKAENTIKQLTGEEIPHEPSFIQTFMKPFTAFAGLSYKAAILGGGHGHGHEESSAKNNWLNMTEGQKKRVTMVEEKISKPMYNVKIRMLYMAPADKYDKGRRFEIIGGYRYFTTGYYNTIKTFTPTWTKVDYLISEPLERPYLQWETRRRKTLLFKGFKNRSMYIGAPKFILNTEELATLYHFPITKEGFTVPAGIEATASKKVPPPRDLPILEEY